MAEGALFAAAIEFAENVLVSSSVVSWQRLRAAELPGRSERRVNWGPPVAGWKVTLDVDGEPEVLLLAVDASFPFSWPIVFFPNNERFLLWPHVERDGRICLVEDGQRRVSGPQAIGLLLTSAATLIRANRQGLLNEDFAREFLSYWEQSCSSDVRTILSMTGLSGPSRLVQAWIGATRTVVADSADELRRWHAHLFGDGVRLKKTVEVPLIWVDAPPSPKDFPYTNGDVYELVKTGLGEDFANKRWLGELHALSDTGSLVLLGATTPEGPVLVGVWTTPSAGARDGHPRGFRPNRSYPLTAVLQQVLSSRTPARRVMVKRCDGVWVHSRGGTVEQPELLDRTAVVIGCGSLGSAVATLLAQSGVGRLILVDPEGLTFDNVARHELGAIAVGTNKAASLAQHLGARFPHLSVEGHACRWESLHEKAPSLLREADVVVSLTADWLSELSLNMLTRSPGRFPPVVFGWAENQACAGHALAVAALGGCLECGLDSAGGFLLPVVAWPGDAPVSKEPACGAYYQPYGAIDMAPVYTLIAETVLDVLYGRLERSELRTWLGRVERLRSLGGEISDAFLDAHGDPGDGARAYRSPWTIQTGCRRCR